MFELLTDSARQVISLAHDEAQRLNHEYVGTEHLLLGIAEGEPGIAIDILRGYGLDADRLRGEVERTIPRGPSGFPGRKLPLTPRSLRAVEHAVEEARALGSDRAGPEHLLIGVLREDLGIAAQILITFGLNTRDLRESVAQREGLQLEGRPHVRSVGSGTKLAPGRLDEILFAIPYIHHSEVARKFQSIVSLMERMERHIEAREYMEAAQLRDRRKSEECELQKLCEAAKNSG